MESKQEKMILHFRLHTAWIAGAICCLVLLVAGQPVFAQSFGVELANTLMPASGGMSGTSIAEPQDLLSAISANPASLRQFRGTQFQFGGAWLGTTYNIGNTGGVLPNIGNYAVKSQAPGSALGNIGVSQDFSALGRPVTGAVALTSTAGAGLDASQVAESNGTSSAIAILAIGSAMGIDLTDQLSLGFGGGLVSSSFTGLFSGSSKPSLDYALRGNVGLNFRTRNQTRIAGYYKTGSSFTFENAIVLDPGGGGPVLPNQIGLDIPMDLPQNVGIGISNGNLINGRLLMAVDVTYWLWNDATLFNSIYKNQLGVQFGTQFQLNDRVKLRMGYTWNENPLRDNVGIDVGGITVGQDAVQYVQAQFATISQHKFTGGIGITDVRPGVDFDLFIGGMPRASQQFGASFASIESYWIGGGLSWRFRRGSGRCIAPDHWCTPEVCSTSR